MLHLHELIEDNSNLILSLKVSFIRLSKENTNRAKLNKTGFELSIKDYSHHTVQEKPCDNTSADTKCDLITIVSHL